MRRWLIRYILLGALCFGIDYGVALVLISVLPLLIANTIAFLAANLVNFILGHYCVFRPENRQRRLVHTYAYVLAISGIGLLLNNAVVWLGVAMMGFGLFFTNAPQQGLRWAGTSWHAFSSSIAIRKKHSRFRAIRAGSRQW